MRNYFYFILATFAVWPFAVWPCMALAQPGQGGNGNNAKAMLKQQELEKMMRMMMGGRDEVTDAQLAKVSVTLEEEKKFGKQVTDYYLGTLKSKGFELVESGEEVEYLRDLLDAIREKNNVTKKYKTLRVVLAESPEVEAMTIVGGVIVVHRGLLDFLENEAELAGVMGHELSHLERNHLTRPIRRAKYLEKNVAGGGFSMDKLSAMFDVMRDQFMKPFRPEDEAQADRDGATWIYALGYDPRALARMFARVGRKKDAVGAMTIPFFQSHPAYGDRERDIMATYDELQKKKPKNNLELGVKNLADREPLFGKDLRQRAP